VAALLVIAARSDKKPTIRYRDDELSGNILWKELKKQIEALRKEMDGDDSEDSTSRMSMAGMWPAMSGIFDKRLLDERIVDDRRAEPLDVPNRNQAFNF